MQKSVELKLLPRESADDSIIRTHAAEVLGVDPTRISGFQLQKRSIDARGRQARVILTIKLFIDEPAQNRPLQNFEFKDVSRSVKQVIIVGAGPAGLFAALKLIEQGIRPVILERGKDIRSRRRDLALLNKEGTINPESNYCFGEGGAGTYSDGKLYTRSTKRGNVTRILQLFLRFGADENILYDAHPHIGTNKLPAIITAMRQQIMDCGGELLFEKKVADFILDNDSITGVKTSGGELFQGSAVILATGHSARDIFELLLQKKIHIEFKPFALGVRIEHPQNLINDIQYHWGPLPNDNRTLLPPASYGLVEQVDHKAVFSFCMCPGGIIAPAATNPGELVVNGWSPSKRNNPFANSGIVVNIDEKEIQAFKKWGPLAGMYFQQSVEQRAYQYGGGNAVAPAQRMVDFTDNIPSASLPPCSYIPGISSIQLKDVLPDFVTTALRHAFVAFGKKMKGYYTNEAVILATESRTSSPVRIPRDQQTLQHPGIKNLYPCGEGAGYAGGIVSAAMDGERVADQIALSI